MSSNNNLKPIVGNDSYVKIKDAIDVSEKCPGDKACVYQTKMANYPLEKGATLHFNSTVGTNRNFQQMNIVHADKSTSLIQVDIYKGEVRHQEMSSEGKVTEKHVVQSDDVSGLVSLMIKGGVFDQGMLTYKEAEAALDVHALLKKVVKDNKIVQQEVDAVLDACAVAPINPLPTKPKSNKAPGSHGQQSLKRI